MGKGGGGGNSGGHAKGGSGGGGGGGGGSKAASYTKTFDVPRGPQSARVDHVHISKSSDGTRSFSVDHEKRS